MMKILITGGAGYIGSSLNNYLSTCEDMEVTCVTRSHFDLADSKQTHAFFRDKYYDVVIHCAVVGGSRLKNDSWQVLDQNLMMYYNLLSNRGSYERLIHFGSGAEMYSPNTPYGCSKGVISHSITNDSQFFNIRIFAVFDENELNSRFIKSCLTNYIRKQPMVIYKNRYMDFFYMKDLVEVVKYYVRDPDPSFKEYNCSYLSDRNLQTLENIANYVNTLDNYTVPIENNQYFMDTDYITRSFQNIKEIKYIGLHAGIQETYHKLKTRI